MSLSNPECPCINSTIDLQSFQTCETRFGQPGALNNKNDCYPLSYGSDFCKKYDALFHLPCQGNSSIPDYCNESFCYVDKKKCRMSDELLYKSQFFGHVDLYYSYSTCNSSAEGWLNVDSTEKMKKMSKIDIVIPTSYNSPYLWKVANNGGFAGSTSPEYYNSSIPFEGAIIEYMKNILDKERINFISRSRGSDTVFPSSSFSASVRDVQFGISDLAAGPFWVTTERLRMTTFTTPVATDKTFLVTKRPSVDTTLRYKIEKMLKPFDPDLWWLLLFIICLVSLLSIWFASPHDDSERLWLAFRNEEWLNSSFCRRGFIFFRFFLEAFLTKGVFFCGGSPDQEARSTLSKKFLMFGFSVTILIFITTYTANLAAFILHSGVSNYVDSMEVAMNQRLRICAHPAAKGDLQSMWRTAVFVFNYDANEYEGVFDSYDAGECDILAIGEEVRYNAGIMDVFCERDLVFTRGEVIEMPLAFPIRNDFAAGMSHLFYKKERELGLTLETILNTYKPTPKCAVDANAVTEMWELTPLTISEFALPFCVFLVCVGIAVIVKLFERDNVIKVTNLIVKSTGLNSKLTKKLLDGAKFAHLDVDDVSNALDNIKHKADSSNDEKRSSSRRGSYHRSISTAFKKNSIGDKRNQKKRMQSFSEVIETEKIDDNVESKTRKELTKALSSCVSHDVLPMPSIAEERLQSSPFPTKNENQDDFFSGDVDKRFMLAMQALKKVYEYQKYKEY